MQDLAHTSRLRDEAMGKLPQNLELDSLLLSSMENVWENMIRILANARDRFIGT